MLALLARRAFKVFRARLEMQARQALREALDQPVPLDRRGILAQQAQRALRQRLRALRGQQERREIQAQLARRACRVFKGFRVILGLRGLLEPPEARVLLGLLARHRQRPALQGRLAQA